MKVIEGQQHINFGSIEQFRHCVKELQKSKISTIKLVGTVKLHGTHCDIVVKPSVTCADTVYWCQSRN